MADSSSNVSPTGDIFATTHWTVVLAAGQSDEPNARVALEQLCRIYWFPLYLYIRRHGHSKEDAEDLTQTFFARFLQKNYLANLDNTRGRFRAFLLAALKNFLANEWDKSQRHKRGGGLLHLSLDWQTADTQFQVTDANELSPEEAFDRDWAVTLLGKVLDSLRQEALAESKAAQFEQLKAFLMTGKEEASYAQTAQVLGWQETAVRVAVHRLRKRYRQLLREEIANTVADHTQVDEELRALFAAFRR